MAGRKIRRGVLIPFHSDADHLFAIPAVYSLNHNTGKENDEEFGYVIINFPDFLLLVMVSVFWGGSKFSTTK